MELLIPIGIFFLIVLKHKKKSKNQVILGLLLISFSLIKYRQIRYQ